MYPGSYHGQTLNSPYATACGRPHTSAGRNVFFSPRSSLVGSRPRATTALAPTCFSSCFSQWLQALTWPAEGSTPFGGLHFTA